MSLDQIFLHTALKSDIFSGHQAFLTVEALKNIAETTLQNLQDLRTGTCKYIVEK